MTNRKPKVTVELEPGEYLVSVHPSGTHAWKHDGFGVFTGHGAKLKRTAVSDAIRDLELATRRQLGIDEPITRYHQSRGVEDLEDLFTFTRGDDTARCGLRTQPAGWEMRLWENDSVRSLMFDDEEQMLNTAIEWKQAKLAAGWTLTGSRIRIRYGTFDIAWNLIIKNPQ